jgi:hypothetical protein
VISENKVIILSHPSSVDPRLRTAGLDPAKGYQFYQKQLRSSDGDDLRIRRFLYAMGVYHTSLRAERGVQMRVLEVLHTAASGINKLQS